MFRSIKEFSQFWRQHADATQKIMDALNDKSLSQKVSPDDRTLGRVAWHIVQTIPEMAGRTGLKVDGPDGNAPLPGKAAEIQQAYRTASKSLLEQVEKNWDDNTLKMEDDMYGSNWPRGLSLRIIMDHEIHHRAQMTVLMRQAGLRVPGVFGPSREEWSQHGMEAPEI
ncbi:conserved hypothetical protein [Candidatus Zixiibacteriota bacterium]|nr:conserved hypothetical protein [candidate division Zixibacteria bacterium]